MDRSSVTDERVVRIVSFLGTTNYDLAGYELDASPDKVILTSLNDAASILDAFAKGADRVEVVIIGTEQVATTWMPQYERVLREASLEDAQALRARTVSGLERPLAAYFDDDRLTWGFVRAPQGKNMGESWALFDVVRRLASGDALDLAELQAEVDRRSPPGALPPADVPWGIRKLTRAGKVHVDITNGFRSQPFFASSALAYLVTNEQANPVRDRTVGYAVYATEQNHFGKGTLQTAPPERPTRPEPVAHQDVSRTLEAFRWTAAVHALMRYGRADELESAVAAFANEHPADAEIAKAFGAAAVEFADSLCTIRLPNLITVAAPRLGRTTSDFRKRIAERLPPLSAPLAELTRWAQAVQATEVISDEGLRAAMGVIELCMSLNRYAEAVAVLRETLVTLWSLERKRARALSHTKFSKDRRRRERQLGGTAQCENLIVESDSKARVSPRRVAALFKRVADTRNDVLHAGFRSKAPDAPTILHHVEALRRDLATLIDERLRAGK